MNSLPRSAIVIIIDRLGAAHLGPYGNTWIETPALNRLAGQSTLWENPISDSPILSDIYRSYWHGFPAYCRNSNAAQFCLEKENLLTRLATAGTRVTLVTDHQWVAQRLPERVVERVDMSGDLATRMAANVGQTQFGRMMAVAVDWLRNVTGSSLLWLHADSGNGLWDAPFLIRDHFTEEGDPPPSECLVPPNLELEKNSDPDDLLAFMHAYAGQVVAIDTCLDILLRSLEGLPVDEQPLLLLTSPRGFSLGEHGRIGACGDDLYAEVLQVPWLIRLPGGELAGQRRLDLIQPADLHTTLCDFFGLEGLEATSGWGRSLLPAALPAPARHFACSIHDQSWAIRTPLWFLRKSSNTQLFAKPDDRWEVNEVSSRCEDVVETLTSSLSQIRQAAASGDASKLPTLATESVV